MRLKQDYHVMTPKPKYLLKMDGKGSPKSLKEIKFALLIPIAKKLNIKNHKKSIDQSTEGRCID